MRKAPSILMLSIAVPALSALPVLTPPAAKPEPVAPEVRAVALAGVDGASLLTPAGAQSKVASAVARTEVIAADQRGRVPTRPAVFTKARGTADFELLGVTWRTGTPADLTVVVRTHGEDGWTGWTALDPAPAPDRAEGAMRRAGTEPLYTGPADGYQVRIDVRSGTLPSDVRVDLIDPGDSDADESVGASGPPASASAAMSQPRIYTRKEWGADESLRDGSPNYTSSIKAGFVHHTAGANGYASSDVPKILRGIYAYHTKSNGWSDVGYNFLVDRFGRVWEGRYGGVTKPVLGAHTGGFNSETFGVSALGNFDKTAAPAAMTDAIAAVMAWKLSLHYVNPNGTTSLTSSGGGTSRYPAGRKVTVNVISAHRNMGYTSCPGTNLYAKMSTIRSKVAAYVGPGLVAPSAPTTTGSVRVRSGVVKSTQAWSAKLRHADSGHVVRQTSGSGPVDSSIPYRDSADSPLPGGRYLLSLESWSGSVQARPYEKTLIVAGSAAADDDRELLLSGHGYGHGRGLSQWGAYGAATAGLTYNQIIAFYYPGTALSSLTDGVMRVNVTGDNDNTTEVDWQAGLALCHSGSQRRDLPSASAVDGYRLIRTTGGLRLQSRLVAGGWSTWRSVVPQGGEATFTTSASCSATPSTEMRLVLPNGQREGIRGTVRAVAFDAHPRLETVGVLTMTNYLRSVVPAEMPASWHGEALKAQSVAARSYAARLRAAPASAAWDVCDTTACQVFAGSVRYAANGAVVTRHEDSRSDAAVSATAGKFVTYKGKVALTEFSASNGGWTVAGGTTTPYLVAKSDPYDGRVASASNPHTWNATVPVATLHEAYPAIGRFTSMTVVSRDGRGEWGGRAVDVRLNGAWGAVTVSGSTFRTVTGIKSTWWAPRFGARPHDLTSDGRTDLFTREAGTGRTRMYAGNGSGGFAGPGRVQGGGWQVMSEILVPGDMDGDGRTDVVTVNMRTGDLLLYPGNGSGWVAPGRVIGRGWNIFSTLVAPGDWSGDGLPDILAVNRSTGKLLLYRGDGRGGVRAGTVVGAGWQVLDRVVGVGDIDGDTHPELLAREGSTGDERVYHSNGRGGFAATTTASSGWRGSSMTVGPGDWSGDGRPDLLAVDQDGVMRLFVGNGSTFATTGQVIGRGWNALDLLS